MPNTFVFDLAGVLIDWNPHPFYQRFFNNDEERVNVFFSTVFSEAVQTKISEGQSIDQILDDVCHAHPLYADAVLAYRDHWHELHNGAIGGAVSVLEELRERGHRTFALGNWSRTEFEWAVSDFDFIDGFDDVLLSGDCGILKPDPQIYALAEERFSLIPEETVFVDDRADNVQTALSRNWNGVVFENPRQLYLTFMEYNIL